ncbi:MAG: 30S ribosomal protein S12 methylthiotransferase RimO [Planctomycetota bacterium]|nr:30S ribosomal protein S12 methylthiotransferase RimO [Planctomycetota bacterium]
MSSSPVTEATAPLGRVALVSLGCAKNLVDSERLVQDLGAAGFALAETLREADLALVNTCGFIDPAKEESIETIVRVAAQKEFGRLRGVMVAGCLVERYAQELEEQIPEVDRWLPFNSYPRIVESARELMDLPQVRDLAPERTLLTPSAYAYLKVSEGCDQKCAFCAIPSFRGRLASRTIEANVEDARSIAARGVGEINIVSQDTTAYGRDLYGKPRLAELLRELTKIEGPSWWRVLYLYPSILRDDVIDEMADNPRIAKYVDLPLQHMSDGMLRAMRRGINAKRQIELLERLRDRIPDVAIRTTLITGFPGETDADHAENLRRVSQGWFQRLGVFTYSPEEGTRAFDLPDAIPAEVAEARRDELMAAQQPIHFAHADAQVGRVVDVLLEQVEPLAKRAVGRTQHDAPDVDGTVRVRGIEAGRAGAVVPVRIVAREDYDLVGEPVGAPEPLG